MPVERWVAVDTAAHEIVGGPWLWEGPSGDGDLWSWADDGVVWTSDHGAVCTAPGEVTQWYPPCQGLMALEVWAQGQGFTVRPIPGPPPQPDTDGDGVPDDQDPAPEDPTIQ
jgi:hypothetical protein